MHGDGEVQNYNCLYLGHIEWGGGGGGVAGGSFHVISTQKKSDPLGFFTKVGDH